MHKIFSLLTVSMALNGLLVSNVTAKDKNEVLNPFGDPRAQSGEVTKINAEGIDYINRLGKDEKGVERIESVDLKTGKVIATIDADDESKKQLLTGPKMLGGEVGNPIFGIKESEVVQKLKEIAETDSGESYKPYDELLLKVYGDTGVGYQDDRRSSKYGYITNMSGSEVVTPALTSDGKLKIVSALNKDSLISARMQATYVEPGNKPIPQIEIKKKSTTTTSLIVSEKDGSFERVVNEKIDNTGNVAGTALSPKIKNSDNVQLSFDRESSIAISALLQGVKNGQIQKDELDKARISTAPSNLSLLFGVKSTRVNELVKYLVMSSTDNFSNTELNKECRAFVKKEMMKEMPLSLRLLLLSDETKGKFVQEFIGKAYNAAKLETDKEHAEYKNWLKANGLKEKDAEEGKRMVAVYTIEKTAESLYNMDKSTEEKMLNWIKEQKIDEEKALTLLTAKNPNAVSDMNKACIADKVKEITKKDFSVEEQKQFLSQMYSVMTAALKGTKDCVDAKKCADNKISSNSINDGSRLGVKEKDVENKKQTESRNMAR